MNNHVSVQSMVSIIIAVYNIEKYISECLESIKNQTYENWEALVIDDGSTDTSLEICKRFAHVDSRFHIISKTNGGSSHARNVGLEKSKGEYVMFVDGDDILPISAVAESVRLMSLYDVDIIGTHAMLMSENGEILSKGNQKSTGKLSAEEAVTLIHSGSVIGGIWSKIYKRTLIGGTRFNQELRIAEDLFFNTELLLNNLSCRVVFTDVITYYYRIRQDSVSHQNTNSKNRTYLEVMTELMNEKAKNLDPKVLSTMAIAQVGVTIGSILRKPFNKRIPEQWHLDVIRNSVRYIPNDRYTKILSRLECHSKIRVILFLEYIKLCRKNKQYLMRMKKLFKKIKSII